VTVDTLAADHRHCAEVLSRSGSSFTLPIRLLPAAKRRGTTALYAFCRRADDIVDDAADRHAAVVALDAFNADVDEALAGRVSSDPMLRALADTVRRFSIPRRHLAEILAGVRMDLDHAGYETFDELRTYCARVAGAVGLAAIHVWGFHSPRALEVAHDCGLAFQLTNILRDIPEDRARGRLYLPASDLAAAGCAVEELTAAAPSSGLVRLAELECRRARDLFLRAAELDGLLSADGRRVFRAMFGVYGCLFRAVERAGAAIFSQRVRTGKARLMAAALLTVGIGPRAILARSTPLQERHRHG